MAPGFYTQLTQNIFFHFLSQMHFYRILTLLILSSLLPNLSLFVFPLLLQRLICLILLNQIEKFVFLIPTSWMGTGTTIVSGRVRKDLSDLPTKTNQNGNIPIVASTENRSNSRKKKIQRRNKKTVICPVQKLFDTCKKVFANAKSGIVPSPQHIDMLRTVLGKNSIILWKFGFQFRIRVGLSDLYPIKFETLNIKLCVF